MNKQMHQNVRSIRRTFFSLVISIFLFAVPLSVSAAPASNTSIFSVTLSAGKRSIEVTRLQEFLTKESLYASPITGFFGTVTRKAVQAFQKRERLKITGIFDTATRNRANAILKARQNKEEVNIHDSNAVILTPSQTNTGASPNTLRDGQLFQIEENGQVSSTVYWYINRKKLAFQNEETLRRWFPDVSVTPIKHIQSVDAERIALGRPVPMVERTTPYVPVIIERVVPLPQPPSASSGRTAPSSAPTTPTAPKAPEITDNVIVPEGWTTGGFMVPEGWSIPLRWLQRVPAASSTITHPAPITPAPITIIPITDIPAPPVTAPPTSTPVTAPVTSPPSASPPPQGCPKNGFSTGDGSKTCNRSTCINGCTIEFNGCPNGCVATCPNTGFNKESGSIFCNLTLCTNGCTTDAKDCPTGCIALCPNNGFNKGDGGRSCNLTLCTRECIRDAQGCPIACYAPVSTTPTTSTPPTTQTLCPNIPSNADAGNSINCKTSVCPNGCTKDAKGCPSGCRTPYCPINSFNKGDGSIDCNYTKCPNGCTTDAKQCPTGCKSTSCPLYVYNIGDGSKTCNTTNCPIGCTYDTNGCPAGCNSCPDNGFKKNIAGTLNACNTTACPNGCTFTPVEGFSAVSCPTGCKTVATTTAMRTTKQTRSPSFRLRASRTLYRILTFPAKAFGL